jgi:hypothetical protein
VVVAELARFELKYQALDPGAPEPTVLVLVYGLLVIDCRYGPNRSPHFRESASSRPSCWHGLLSVKVSHPGTAIMLELYSSIWPRSICLFVSVNWPFASVLRP